MKIEKKKTGRGFSLNAFADYYGASCSIQKSSLADKDAIWFGIDDANPQILAMDAHRLGMPNGSPFPNGWVAYEVPKEVHMTTRMHLTREQVKKLLPILQKFVKTGEV